MIPERTTDITAEWLNSVLHENGFLKDASIVSIRQEPMAIGEGFMSDMAKLTVAYDQDAGQLPKTMVAKLPTAYESARALGMQMNIYERETRFYTEVAPRSPIRTPGLIYGGVDNENQRHALIMEDCSHFEQLDQTVGLTPEQAKLVTLKLADFHARWWDAEDLWSFPWMPKPRDESAMALIDIFHACWDTCAADKNFRKALPEGGWEAGLQINKHFQWLIETVRDDNATIVHSDFRADNMFLDRNTPDDPLVVFDWQVTQVGGGPCDLAYLLGASMTIDIRRQVEEDLVASYYERLVERGVSGYSFEECQTAYLKGLLGWTIIGVLAFARLDTSDPRGTELLSVGLDRWFTSIVDNDATSVLP